MKIVLFASVLCCTASHAMDNPDFMNSFQQAETGRIGMARSLLNQPDFMDQVSRDLLTLSLSELNKHEAGMLKEKNRIISGESFNRIAELEYNGKMLSLIQEAQVIKRQQYYTRLAFATGIGALCIIVGYILYSRWKDKEKEPAAQGVQQPASPTTVAS